MASKARMQKDINRAREFLASHPGKCDCPNEATCKRVRDTIEKIIAVNQERVNQLDK